MIALIRPGLNIKSGIKLWHVIYIFIKRRKENTSCLFFKITNVKKNMNRSRIGPVPLSKRNSDYKEMYEQVSAKFWELQQVEQTDEEIEFMNLISELEEMLTQYRTEIEELEAENSRLLEQVEDVEPIKAKWNELQEQEKHLIALKRDVDNLR